MDTAHITISGNASRIEELLLEMVLTPRINALKWSDVTKQSPNIKIGYPGQHLASLITGVEGTRTGARGDDLIDGTEVKSCSRVDQLDTCKSCGVKVLRLEEVCSACGGADIDRKEDSKWLFGVKSEGELQLLTQTIDRILFTIADYPFFDRGDFSTIRFQAFEIWNTDERHSRFREIMENYYYKIFLPHIEKNPKKTPAPKNFWPYSYQFYLCNPVKVFSCIVKNANTSPEISTQLYVDPYADRSGIVSEPMPTGVLKLAELAHVLEEISEEDISSQINSDYTYSDLVSVVGAARLDKRKLFEILPFIDHRSRGCLPLRDTDKPSTSMRPYLRR